MIHRVCTYLLIAVYALSISAFCIMEVGHDIMHTLKNKIHYHEAGKHHAVADHNVLLTDDRTLVDSLLSSLSFGFLFFESCEMILTDNSGTDQDHFSNEGKSNTLVSAPILPPPRHPSPRVS